MENLFAQSLSKYAEPIATRKAVQVTEQKPSRKNDLPSPEASDSETEEVQLKPPKPERIRDDPEKSKRTLFIGNLPLSVLQKSVTTKLKALVRSVLSDGQKLQSIRFRSIALKKPTQDHKMRKVSIQHSDNLHPDADTVNAYAVLSEEMAVKVCKEKLNGQMFEDHHIRMDHADHKKSFENKRTVFIGNLPLNMTEEALWQFFEKQCSQVEGVRVVRDDVANMGKGIAYVCFKDIKGVKQAINLNGKPSPVVSEKSARPMRISTCVRKLKKTKQFEGQHASKNASRRLKSRKKN